MAVIVRRAVRPPRKKREAHAKGRGEARGTSAQAAAVKTSRSTRKTRILLLLIVLAAVAGFSAAWAQSRRARANKEFMREKLELSQRVLEGLATEDYDLIIARGTRLSAMSKAADWRVFENPDYDQQSVTFRRHVDSLVRAAKDRNLDAATLAYVRLTMSCVDCHKLVRGKLVASLEERRVARN
jgi:cytochrome c556